VFIDEISRCRPEVQNKLFSLIHERCVQGLPLRGPMSRSARQEKRVGLILRPTEHPQAGRGPKRP
jgi:MoxR-like ATPase